MIVNLYVDHLMSSPPATAKEVWRATRDHSKLFSDAAARIGLSPGEFREFQTNLRGGKALFVKLPRRLDAMSGNRHGYVYAVANARLNRPVMGWRVGLADGNVVYVPQVCGNISLLKHPAIARFHAPRRTFVAHRRYVPFTPALAHVPETPVIVTPDEPATVAVAVPAAETHTTPFLFLIPGAIAEAVAGLTHGDTPRPVCSSDLPVRMTPARFVRHAVLAVRFRLLAAGHAGRLAMSEVGTLVLSVKPRWPSTAE